MLESIFILFVVFFSMAVHELFHGLVAYRMGDPTAKLEGRLSLNPLRHIDPFGTILLPFFLWLITLGQGPIFAYAKPVPVNPFLFKDPRYGILKVALAGPLSNFLIGIFFALICRFLSPQSNLFFLFYLISIYNFLFALFNLLPFYPLDGFHILSQALPESFDFLKSFLFRYGFFILLLIIMAGAGFIFKFAQVLFSFFSGT